MGKSNTLISVNGRMMTNQKNKRAACQKTLTNETLGVGDKGI